MLYDRNGNPDPTVTPRERWRMASRYLRDLSWGKLDRSELCQAKLAEAASAVLYWQAVTEGRSPEFQQEAREIWRKASRARSAAEKDAALFHDMGVAGEAA